MLRLATVHAAALRARARPWWASWHHVQAVRSHRPTLRSTLRVVTAIRSHRPTSRPTNGVVTAIRSHRPTSRPTSGVVTAIRCPDEIARTSAPWLVASSEHAPVRSPTLRARAPGVFDTGSRPARVAGRTIATPCRGALLRAEVAIGSNPANVRNALRVRRARLAEHLGRFGIRATRHQDHRIGHHDHSNGSLHVHPSVDVGRSLRNDAARSEQHDDECGPGRGPRMREFRRFRDTRASSPTHGSSIAFRAPLLVDRYHPPGRLSHLAQSHPCIRNSLDAAIRARPQQSPEAQVARAFDEAEDLPDVGDGLDVEGVEEGLL